MTQHQANTTPLSGVRVVDLTNVIAGPVVTRILGQLGAHVIKIEQPWGRTIGGIAMHKPDPNQPRPYNTGALFNEVNRAKMSIAIDLAQEAGGQLLRELISISDIVIENFSPRVMQNLGLNYDSLRAERPDLLMVSMPAIGHVGPWSNHISFGPGTDALAGLSDVTGYEDGPPHKPGNFYSDQNSAFHAVNGIIAALWNRRRTGQSHHLRVVIREATMAIIGEYFVQYQLTNKEPTRIGNNSPYMAPHNVYRCKGDDSWIAIAVASDHEWRQLSTAINKPALLHEDKYATVTGRISHRLELDAIIERWTRGLKPKHIMKLLQGYGVKAGVVFKISEILEDPHYQERGFIDRVEHPDAGPGKHPGLPWRFSSAQTNMMRRAPLFAEHRDWVLNDLLSLDCNLIANLKHEHIVPQVPIER